MTPLYKILDPPMDPQPAPGAHRTGKAGQEAIDKLPKQKGQINNY